MHRGGYAQPHSMQSPTNNAPSNTTQGIDQFSMNVINNVIADLKNSSEQSAGNGGMGAFGMGLSMNGLNGAYNDELGGAGGFGGIEEDEWQRMCENIKNEWKLNFQTQCR